MRRFVADASHELRTPLTSIRGFAELTRQRGDATDPDTMKRIEDEAKRMGLLVDDLLLLARLDQQRPLQHQPVDLLTVAADSVHDVQAVQPEPGHVAADPAGLRGSSGRGRRGAPASGARQPGQQRAAPHAQSTHRSRSRSGPATATAILEVADTGPGLNAEQKARVFERFYRADSARARATGGSGLGLSIVAALVAAHRGRVASPTPPHGATFTVHLPLST